MFTTSITKSYREEQRSCYTIFGSVNLKDSNVFWEYYDIITKSDLKKDEIENKIREYKPKSKASISIQYYDDRIEFLKGTIFPVFYIVFK